MISLRERLLAVPRWDRFLSVDALDASVRELHAANIGVSRLEEIGHSRAGSPLSMLTVGRGSRHALVLGMPHPNEPTGALASLWLAELLCRDDRLRDQLGLVWHFLPCADPDGSRLNEGWFGGPFTPVSYAARLYRPPFEEQFEWTFHDPALAEPGLPSTPESRAVMAVIDSLRPELVLSMHNAEDGGFYTYVTDKSPDLTSDVELIGEVSGIPLEVGEPDGPGTQLAPGIFHSPAVIGGGPGLCSTDYAGRYGAFGLTVEPPLWVDPRAGDDSAAPLLAAGTFEAARARTRRLHQGWLASLRTEIDLDTVRGRAVLSDAEFLASEWPPHGSRTIAEVAAWERGIGLERRRAAGHVLALLGTHTGSLTPLLKGVREDASAALASWTSRQDEETFVGLDAAVACHVGVALAAAALVSGAQDPGGA